MFGIGHYELLIILVVLFVIVAALIRVLKRKNPSSKSTSSERLKELQKIKDDGLITEDEFNKKRNEILSSL